MQAPGRYAVAFIPGVGDLDYWCGVCESTYQIATHMQTRPLLIADGPHSLARRLAGEGSPVEVVPLRAVAFKGFRSAGVAQKARLVWTVAEYAVRLWRVLRRHRVRVVYTANTAAIVAAVPAKLAGCKVVTAIRGSPDGAHKRPWLFRISDRTAVLSNEMARQLLEQFAARPIPGLERRIVVIYNGIDLKDARERAQAAAEVRSSLGLLAGDLLVLYVGAFRREKGQLGFIEQVVPRIHDRGGFGGRLCVAFLGSATNDLDREYEAQCREAAGSSPFGSFLCFAGFQGNVWPWYAAADLSVLASEAEGMPRCVIESMACGKPVVCYDVCSARELLEESGGGIVVPQGHAESMAAAIIRLARDADLRAQMGARARAFAEAHLDIGRVAERYDALFEDLLAN